jgi:hypothetical protein
LEYLWENSCRLGLHLQHIQNGIPVRSWKIMFSHETPVKMESQGTALSFIFPSCFQGRFSPLHPQKHKSTSSPHQHHAGEHRLEGLCPAERLCLTLLLFICRCWIFL